LDCQGGQRGGKIIEKNQTKVEESRRKLSIKKYRSKFPRVTKNLRDRGQANKNCKEIGSKDGRAEKMVF